MSAPMLDGHPAATTDVLHRLGRIEGQVRGIARMVEDDRYCIDVLTQVAAASRALQGVALALLDQHMSHCLVEAARAGGPDQEAKIKEASQAIARLVRS
ncbi:metal-sensitive transcriptional regulator [uncultured Cellulomonas sp.]|uniref:metal-sensitive transcriptional regulator n=1 Tax=uncultured Cellulomonas sp. TaxID=189682 RepID=UPI00261F0CB2|nr:metal-sensitive transcriptional regulator [uncultured Cellulomonas sp.]